MKDFHVEDTQREKCPHTGPYFFVVSPNTGKYRPEKTPYFDTFHAVRQTPLFCFIEDTDSSHQ